MSNWGEIMKKILASIGLLFLMAACSSTEKVISSSSSAGSSGGSVISRNQTTVKNIGKFQVDSLKSWHQVE